MKLTKSQLRKIIKEEIEAVVSEDEQMGPPINQAAFLPDDLLHRAAQDWIDELMSPAIKAAEAGDPGAQKFLDRVGTPDAASLIQALRDVTMGEKGSDKTIHTLAKSLEKEKFGGGYQK